MTDSEAIALSYSVECQAGIFIQLLLVLNRKNKPIIIYFRKKQRKYTYLPEKQQITTKTTTNLIKNYHLKWEETDSTSSRLDLE